MSNYFKSMMDSPLKAKPEVITFAITSASTGKDKYTVCLLTEFIIRVDVYFGDENAVDDMGSAEKI